jgi:hypothetical protein
MKFEFIIDACSFINLGAIQVGNSGESLLDLIQRSGKISIVGEVDKEIYDHYSRNLPSYLRRRRHVKSTNRMKIGVYEKIIAGSVQVSRKSKNKGEVDSFALAIDLHSYSKVTSLVFLSDDENAKNGVLRDWIAAFPGILVWSSYDLVLYLYAIGLVPSKDLANSLIRDVFTENAPPLKERTDKFTQKGFEIVQKNNSKIENIFRLCY